MKGHFDLGNLSPTRYFFTIAVVLGLLFAMVAEDEGVPLGLSLIQWQLQSLLPMALLVLSHVALSYIDAFNRLGAWIKLFLSGLAGATLFAPLALIVEVQLMSAQLADPVLELVHEWMNVMPPVTLCWITINLPWVLGYRLQRDTVAKAAEDSPAAGGSPDKTGFMVQVDQSLRGELLCLKAELHYLLVMTDKGKTLLLYNLKDAVDELGDTQGMQVHRSWWVAADAVDSMTRSGRQGELVLKDGSTVPVSRNRLKAVTAWVEQVSGN